MTIVLYKNSAEFNRVDKTSYLTEVSRLSGTLRDSTSVTEPVIMIEYSSVPDFNYVFIPEFERYYFVDDYIIDVNNVYVLKLSVDVLMTYKVGILTTNAFVTRNEHINYSTSFGRDCGRQVDKNRVIIEGYDIKNVEIINNVLYSDSEYNNFGVDNTDPRFALSGYKIRCQVGA